MQMGRGDTQTYWRGKKEKAHPGEYLHNPSSNPAHPTYLGTAIRAQNNRGSALKILSLEMIVDTANTEMFYCLLSNHLRDNQHNLPTAGKSQIASTKTM